VVRRLPADVRRAEIVQVAQEAMAELGFRRLSLREVARRAGMSAPGVAKHFPTMESLLEAVLAWRDSTELTDILVAAPGRLTFIEVLDRAADLFVAQAAERVRFDALEAEAVMDSTHPAHLYFVSRFDANVQLLRPILEREYEDPAAAVAAVGIVLDGLRMRWLREKGERDFVGDLRAVRALLETGLVRRSDA
jgi:AcrR family transcriptional regulator